MGFAQFDDGTPVDAAVNNPYFPCQKHVRTATLSSPATDRSIKNHIFVRIPIRSLERAWQTWTHD
jgi:hypothetical protein